MNEVDSKCEENNTWYAEMNLKVSKAMKQVDPLHERMSIIEQFNQKSVPLLTHLQISDALQEFLCLPD